MRAGSGISQSQRECLEFLREGPATLDIHGRMTRHVSAQEFYQMPVGANSAFLRLMARQLIQANADGLSFSLTAAGRSYMAKVRK